ncbi:TetR/AcrR family transcriptional regulator [Roseovarius sp. ZX-A-9]|uniref:TetR/AcrR family transcriptional regulator n=1 Tax=Roseovarius sp. ZX-A-9 TaxID=3014783 RepID=UPI00232ED987|nr:TetR/AcrR family transcriptional regulator [Roseovarius sp. ZX-A-9]
MTKPQSETIDLDALGREVKTSDSGQARTSETRNRIIEVAEGLFAHRSYAAVSMREITTAAGVGLAAVNYHFGSKEGLFKAVFLRRATDLNRERAQLLEAADKRAEGGVVPLREVLSALLRPGIRWSFDTGGRGLFIQFLTRLQLDQSSPLHEIFYNDVGHLRRFIPYFSRVLPELSEEEILWRLHFTLGALHYTITDLKRLERISEGVCDISQFEATLERIVSFAEAGFRGNGPSLPPRERV